MNYLACLPMYDFEEVRAATDALWGGIAQRVPNAPAALTRGGDLYGVWTDPGLLLAQTCGFPLVTALKRRVRVVATPRYAAEGCEGAWYRSAIVVRDGDPARGMADLRGRRCAVNGMDSNSGMSLLRGAVSDFVDASQRFFATTVLTGAHVQSLRAVAEGEADVAAIDCVTWALLGRMRPAAVAGLRVLGWSGASPGLPLITALDGDVAGLRAVLEEVAVDPGLAWAREALLLEGFSVLPSAAYDVIDARPGLGFF